MKGLFAETLFSALCVRHGLQVSKPMNPSSKYDFIVDNGLDLFKIQVKSTATFKKSRPDTMDIKLHGNTGHSRHNSRRKYKPNEVDIFAIFIEPLNDWYIIPYDEVEGKRYLTIYPYSETSKYLDFKENWRLMKRDI